jgi:integrase/recombinase XerD
MSDIDEFLNSVLRKRRVTELDTLIEYESFCGKSEGKSQNTINLTIIALTKLKDFLYANQLPTDSRLIGADDIRNFILHLQASKRFVNHPYIRRQDNELSAISINCYLRSIRAAFNRWVAEGFLEETPFEKVKVPKAPIKVIPTFSQEQLEALFNTINISTPEGFRNHLLILFYLDTACRLTEITNLNIDDVNMKERCLRILGKGNKERIVPISRTTQKLLWKYFNLYRPEPVIYRHRNVFLTKYGRPLTKNRVEAIIKKCGTKAGITGVRCSPHTIRHTSCVFWIRNGGDIFSLQKITGHSSLEVLRGYVNLAKGDVTVAHEKYSAVENLELKKTRKCRRTK